MISGGNVADERTAITVSAYHLLRDHLRAVVGLRSFAQEDPKTVYKKEGTKEFDDMWENLQDRVTDAVFRMEDAGAVKRWLYRVFLEVARRWGEKIANGEIRLSQLEKARPADLKKTATELCRKAMVAISVCVVLSTVPLFMLVGKNFIPQDDRSEFQASVRAPEGTSLAAL